MAVVIYLEKSATGEDINRIEEELNKSSVVTGIRYISSGQALANFQEKFPEMREIIDNLKINPFSSSFELSIDEEHFTSADIQNFVQRMRNLGGIEDVQFSKEWVEKVQSVSRLVKAVGFFLGGILILASFFIISNVIKLNVLARKGEIEILRLVGATNAYIRIPFLTEGIILGILGGLLSLLFLLILIEIFPFYLGSSLGALQEFFSFRYLTFPQSLLLILGGAVIGCLGSFSSLARFLKT